MKWDKYGLVVRKGRILWARCGIVPWIPNHQAAKLCITKVAESLEEGILGYGNQNRFHRLELWYPCAELQCFFRGKIPSRNVLSPCLPLRSSGLKPCFCSEQNI